MLWDIIRDFYVQYIFGGTTSTKEYFSGYMGKLYALTGGANSWDSGSGAYSVITGSLYDDRHLQVNAYMSMGDWLSTTFTVITLIVFVFILYIFLKWLFKTVSGLFLLKR